jgi:hypothetical protein
LQSDTLPALFNDAVILTAAGRVFELYLLLGGTDKVAKGSELITALQKKIEESLTLVDCS